MFGTCAGLILLAKRVVGYDEPHIGVMDVTVERNSFGRQRESFEAELIMLGVAEDFPAVFIRAPILSKQEKMWKLFASMTDVLSQLVKVIF